MIGRLRTVAKLAAGFAALLIGIVLSLPGVPGPGIVVILLGLWLLSDHFEWARRMLAWMKDRAARMKERHTAGRGGAVPPGMSSNSETK